MITHFKRINKFLLQVEPFVLVLILVAYWFPSPQRDQYIWMIAALVPIMLARFALHRRLWTNTLYDELCLAFIALCLINIYASPFTPRSVVIFRPLFGMTLLLYCVEYARTRGNLNRLLGATVIAAMFTGFVSLTAVNWTGKASQTNDVTRFLPQLQTFYPFWEGGFNPNELAGVLAYLLPLAAGLAVRNIRLKSGFSALLRIGAGIAAFMMLAGLLLGQSLSAIAGCAVGLVVVFTPRGLWRYSALGGVLFIVIAQIAIMASPSNTITLLKSLSPREGDNSLNHREVIWLSANAMLADHPLTGTGMSNFRFLRGPYPTPGYENVLTPHAHNEILQIGADLGLPGIIVFVGWYGVSGYLLLMTWKRGDDRLRILAVSLAGGLISHAIYGLADAIPLWDRFYFIHWLMLGLTAAAALLASSQSAETIVKPSAETSAPEEVYKLVSSADSR